MTRQGTFAIELINQTSAAIGNIRLGVSVASGPTQPLRAKTQTLAPGMRVVIDTGRVITAPQVGRIKVVVLNADVFK